MGYFKLKLLRHPSLVLHIRALDCDHFLSARVKIWRSRTCASALFVLLPSICFIQRALQRSHCRLHCSRSQISLITWRESFVGRPVAIVDISTYRTIYGYERDHFWWRDILWLIIFFIIKNNDYINSYIKMNITNILVDRAASVISSALCGGGGA